MRSPYLVHGLLTGLLLVACSKDDAATDGGSGSGTDSGSDSDTATTTNPSGASNSGGNACVPGASVECACTNGTMGAQMCAADGDSFEACECEGSSGSVSNATIDPTNPTDSATDPTNVTLDPGTTTGPIDTTGPVDTTGPIDTTTGGGVCLGLDAEPNENEAQANEFGDQACAAPDGIIAGALIDDADIDWSVFHSVDSMACGFENPFVSLTLTASDSVRLCVFADCDEGMAAFECANGAMDATSPNDLPGCCDNGDITFQFNCSGSPNESAQFFVRVDQAPADACVDYTVGYSFGPMN